MSRNGSGTYSILNTFTSGTRVLSADVNANFSDIATALTGSLALDGQSVMTGQFKSMSGTVSAPGQSWANELASGWYRAGAADFRYAVAGADVLKVTAAGFAITGTLTVSGAITGTVTLADGSIATAKLADGAVTTVKIADANVTFAKLDTAAFASQAEAEAGSSSTKLVTPQRVAQAIAALAPPAVVVSVAVAEVATMSTATALIPYDDTIPQITEGTEIVTISVTTTTNTQRVRLRYSGTVQQSVTSNNLTAALFVDSGANALAASTMFANAGATNLTLDKIVSPGAAGTYTYRIRVGGNSAATFTFNGSSGSRIFGAVAAQRLVAEVLN